MAKDKETMRCSFCGRTSEEVRKLVAGPNVFICDECIEVCQSIIEEELGAIESEGFALKEVPTPKEIKAHLDQYVIGKDSAKISLAVENAISAVQMADKGVSFSSGEGIVGESADETIKNIGQMAKLGMRTTDVEILNIMLSKH